MVGEVLDNAETQNEPVWLNLRQRIRVSCGVSKPGGWSGLMRFSMWAGNKIFHEGSWENRVVLFAMFSVLGLRSWCY